MPYIPKKRKPRLSELVPSGDLPPAKEVQRFITFYVASRDLERAACLASLDPKMGAVLYRQEKVRQSINHKINLVDVENAKLKAKADTLTVDLLDSVLAEEVKSKKNPHVRLRALELGYKRTGLIRDGEFYVAPDPNTNRDAPTIYQFGQTTLRRTVTEEVTQTLPQPAESSVPAFTVIEY